MSNGHRYISYAIQVWKFHDYLSEINVKKCELLQINDFDKYSKNLCGHVLYGRQLTLQLNVK